MPIEIDMYCTYIDIAIIYIDQALPWLLKAIIFTFFGSRAVRQPCSNNSQLKVQCEGVISTEAERDVWKAARVCSTVGAGGVRTGVEGCALRQTCKSSAVETHHCKDTFSLLNGLLMHPYDLSMPFLHSIYTITGTPKMVIFALGD